MATNTGVADRAARPLAALLLFLAAGLAPAEADEPAAQSYFVWEDWGGTWHDANKTLSNTDDDNMCWAAAAANVLAWGGWDAPGLETADAIWQHFQDHWTDQGGFSSHAWTWWFTGTNPQQGNDRTAQVDVPGGGGFYPEAYLPLLRRSSSHPSLAGIHQDLQDGYGVTLAVSGPGSHAITCWGVQYSLDPLTYHGVWVTDSDDDRLGDEPPRRLRYYAARPGTYDYWFLDDFYGSDDWHIDTTASLHIPEPVSLGLWTLACGLLAARRRRRTPPARDAGPPTGG